MSDVRPVTCDQFIVPLLFLYTTYDSHVFEILLAGTVVLASFFSILNRLYMGLTDMNIIE